MIELIKLLNESDDPVTLSLHSNQVKFTFAGIEIVRRTTPLAGSSTSSFPSASWRGRALEDTGRTG